MRSLITALALALAVAVPSAWAATINGTKRPDRIAVEGNGTTDRVRCGAGRDVVTADLGDRIAADCEVVSRQLSRDTTTGEIDAETLRSLGVGSGAGRPAARPQATVAPGEENNDGEQPSQSAEISPPQPYAAYPSQRPPAGAYGAGPGPGQLRPVVSGVFAGTPYEIAPPDLQRRVIVGAQALLARYGYYRSGIDGEFGPGTQAALRGFQARAGLVPDGRLNMETLAALGLLPGQHGPGFRPPRRLLPRPTSWRRSCAGR